MKDHRRTLLNTGIRACWASPADQPKLPPWALRVRHQSTGRHIFWLLCVARACRQFCTPASAASAVPSANSTPASASAADALDGNGATARCPAGGRMAVGANGSHVVCCGACGWVSGLLGFRNPNSNHTGPGKRKALGESCCNQPAFWCFGGARAHTRAQRGLAGAGRSQGPMRR